jgi:hypothetical protein
LVGGDFRWYVGKSGKLIMLPYENVLDHPVKPGNKDQMIWQFGDFRWQIGLGNWMACSNWATKIE